MRQTYRLLVWTVLLGLSPAFNRVHAQYGPGQAQPLPIYEGLRETLKWIHFPRGRSGNTAARPTEVRSRLIATTTDVFNGTNFFHAVDSLKIFWHDTAGAVLPYWLSGAYYANSFIGYDNTNPRRRKESMYFLADSFALYKPSGAAFADTPYSITSQVISGNALQSAQNRYDGALNNRQEFFYNAMGDVTVMKRYVMMGSSVGLRYIDSFTYDNNGNLLLYKVTDMDALVPFTDLIEQYTYDSDNQVVQEDYFGMNAGTTPSYRFTHTYNTLGKRTSSLFWTADTVTGVLTNYARDIYTYFSNNKLQSRAMINKWTGNWDTTERVWYEYGTADMPEVAYIMDDMPGLSVDTTRKIRYYYNSQGLCDSAIFHTYLGANTWRPSQKSTMRYNDFGKMTFLDSKRSWNSVTNTWAYAAHDFQAHYYYELFDTRATGIKDTKSSLVFSMYPNPVTGGALHIQSPAEPIKLISVYDLTGRLLIRQQVESGKREVVFSLGELPAGTYILNVSGDKSQGSKKIVVR